MSRWLQRRTASRPGGRTRFRLGYGALVVLTALPLSVRRSPLAAQAPTSLTVYNDGRILVRRSVALEVPKGASQHRLALGPLDPATIVPLDPEVAITGAYYDGATDQQSVLRRALGRRLVFRSGRDTVSAEVVGVNPERYRLAGGMITFQAPGVPQFPEDLVVLDPVVRLGITSPVPRKELALAYFTSGAAWTAGYQVVLGPEAARVAGLAVVSAGALRIKDAEVQLLAGEVSRAAPALGVPSPLGVAAAREEVARVTEQKVGEFHLYTLPDRLDLEPGITTTTALFDPASARYTRTYEVRGQLPYWGGLPQYGEENEVPVDVTYTVLRPRKTDFGDRPLPGGTVRLFEPDSSGRLQLVGESGITHTPAGEDLRVPAGTAFDLTARRVQTAYSTRRDSVAAGQWRTVATADYRVALRNAGDRRVVIDVIEERGGEWSVVTSSVKPEKLSATRTRFRVGVPPQGSATLTYRLRVIW